MIMDKKHHKSAQLKIGHYVLGETLGAGTFGKVKGGLPGFGWSSVSEMSSEMAFLRPPSNIRGKREWRNPILKS